MRFLLVWLALLTAAPAAAQTQDRLEPLPSGQARLDWARQRLKEAMDDVTRLEPGSAPSLIQAHTDKADLPRFTISVTEEMGSHEGFAFTNAFISSFRQSCDPLRPHGELYQGDTNFVIHTLDCPRLGASGLHLWILAIKDTERSQIIALSAELSRAAALDTRGDRVARAVRIRLFPPIRSIVEAVAVAEGHGGRTDEYDPSKLSVLDPTRGVLKVDALIQTGGKGTFEIDIRSCNSIRLREIEDQGRRLVREIEIDLPRFASLVSRSGPSLAIQAGTYGEETRYPTGAPPVRGPLSLEAAVREPDMALHDYYDAYLVIWERFCRPGQGAGPR